MAHDEPPPYFQPGQSVEAFGLSSEAGQLLNGQKGIVISHNKATDRVEVAMGPERNVTRLKSERLRLVNPDSVPKEVPKVHVVLDSEPSEEAKSSGAQAEAAPSVADQKKPADGDAAFENRTLDDLQVDDGIEAFGLKAHLAQYNGTRGVIVQCFPKQVGGGFSVKFSELVIDANGELAEKGQVVTVPRENARVPGKGPLIDLSAQRSRSRSKKKAPVSGFSKEKRSRSRSRSRRRRSRSRRRRSPSRRRRRR
eukprot:TRINITY_DN42717_c0_g1_i2.p1 TRINITY_DN42717_c0_g1~~TRINITY_DN42717_c0_g1_i2.p1  ORF type:complete len:261 (+),score=48.75 TRINITY_DN42717_c0_g1_i2:26-784(+)